MKIHCDTIVQVPLEDIKLNPNNRNTHTPEQIDRLCELIKYHGYRQPGVISTRSGLLAAGEGRYLATKKLGHTHMPCMYQDFDSDEAEYAFGVSDNAIASWATLNIKGIEQDVVKLPGTFNVDWLGIQNFKIDLDVPNQNDPDEVPEVNKDEVKTKVGNLYELGNHRLLCGSCTEASDVERLLEGVTESLCFTSPPYADQREYNDKSLNLDVEHIAKFIPIASAHVSIFGVVLGLMRRNGEVFPYWDSFIDAAKHAGLKFLSWNVWNKMNDVSMGSFNLMFATNHEWIFIFGKEPKKLNLTVPNKHAGEFNDHIGVRQKDGSIVQAKPVTIRPFSQLRTVIDCTPHKARNNDFDHPAMFSVELPEKYMEACTQEGEVVYEPFGGSGTTLIASEKTKRHCRIMEIDPHYCDVIVARWEKYTGKQARLIG